MNKLLLLGLIFVLMSALVFGGCAQPAPAPAPAPSAKPAPAPVPAPASSPATAPAPKPTPAASTAATPKPHPEVKIIIYPAQATAASYVLMFGLSDLLKKNHPWLRFEARETSGIQENLMLISDAKAWKDTLACGASLMVAEVRGGVTPYKQAVDLKALCGLYSMPQEFITLKPDIKTLADLKGKRVGLYSLGGVYEKSLGAMLEAKGIKPGEWTPVKGDFQSFNTGLKAGTMDASINSYMAGKIAVPTLDELMNTNTVYFIQFTADDVKVANEKTIYPWGFTVVPKGTHPKQLQDAPSMVYHLSIYAHPTMDEEVAYETVKFIVEHMKDFPKYHTIANTWTREGFGETGEKEQGYHPGAIKALKELGIKIVSP